MPQNYWNEDNLIALSPAIIFTAVQVSNDVILLNPLRCLTVTFPFCNTCRRICLRPITLMVNVCYVRCLLTPLHRTVQFASNNSASSEIKMLQHEISYIRQVRVQGGVLWVGWCTFRLNSPVFWDTTLYHHHHHHHHIHKGLDQFDPFRLQSYNCSRQRFFGLPIVLLPCGL